MSVKDNFTPRSVELRLFLNMGKLSFRNVVDYKSAKLLPHSISTVYLIRKHIFYPPLNGRGYLILSEGIFYFMHVHTYFLDR